MFARISTFKGKPEEVDKGISVVKEQVLPKLRSIKGFKGFSFLVDRKSGKTIGITYWDTEQDLKASEESANKIRTDTAKSANEEIVSVERFEVPIDEY